MKSTLRFRSSFSWSTLLLILLLNTFQQSFASSPADYVWSRTGLGSGNVNTITGTSSDHLFLVNGGLIHQWNRATSSWQEMSSFSNFVSNSSTLNGASVIAAVGNQIYVGSLSSGGRTAYFDGTTWTEAASGSSVAYNGVFAYQIQTNTEAGDVGQVVSIFARGTGRIYRHVDGSSRSTPSQSGPAYSGGGLAWQAISGSPSDNIIWAVGQGSQIGRSSNSGRSNTWSAVNAPVSGTFFSTVYALDGDTAIVGSRSVGDGTIGVWYTTDAGDTWVDTEFDASGDVLNVYATSLNNIWAVGSGFASHYDGNNWISFAGIAGIQSNDVLRTIHVMGDQIWIGGTDATGNAVIYTGVIPEPANIGLIIGVMGIIVLRFRGKRAR